MHIVQLFHFLFMKFLFVTIQHKIEEKHTEIIMKLGRDEWVINLMRIYRVAKID